MRPAVYIPNFNGSRRLRPVLEALRAQSRPVDVVVADNGSSDDSVEMLREPKLFCVLRSHVRQGGGGRPGHNRTSRIRRRGTEQKRLRKSR